MLMTGSGALGSNLKALNQSLSARVRLPSSDVQHLTLRVPSMDQCS